jgi:hypothetical protein
MAADQSDATREINDCVLFEGRYHPTGGRRSIRRVVGGSSRGVGADLPRHSVCLSRVDFRRRTIDRSMDSGEADTLHEKSRSITINQHLPHSPPARLPSSEIIS